jgi:hypothetical protein
MNLNVTERRSNDTFWNEDINFKILVFLGIHLESVKKNEIMITLS